MVQLALANRGTPVGDRRFMDEGFDYGSIWSDHSYVLYYNLPSGTTRMMVWRKNDDEN
ncbi:MAG: hypothetical protein ACYTFK_13735 [Planctomycetota bacterium]